MIRTIRPTYIYTRAKSTTSNPPSNPWSNTLQLPKATIPLWSEPKQREDPFRHITTQELYEKQSQNTSGELFVVHDGPPYANGSLHMGHALNKILKDIICRVQILQGRRVNFIPGWDCHGLPIENKAVKDLGADPHTLSPQKIRDAARALAIQQVHSQREDMKKFGLVADWTDEGCYRTIDDDYEIRQLRIFQGMVEKGLISRRFRPVHWSPSSRTALAGAELVYNDNHTSRSVYVKFPVDLGSLSPVLRQAVQDAGSDHMNLLVWTTTPWTLPANMAIAVSPDLEYSLIRLGVSQELVIVCSERLPSLAQVLGPYVTQTTFTGTDLLGARYLSVFNRETPTREVMRGSHVSADSGTGLVHTAPAHGPEDYGLFLSHGLTDDIACAVDGEGRFTSDVITMTNAEVGRRLLGKEVLWAGNKEVITILGESGHLLAEEKIKHRYPYDWKTDKPIIVRATSQWFANLADIKGPALSMLRDVAFYPPSSRNQLETYIKERSEWCISRQRPWGVPIPILYDKATDQAILTPESLAHTISILEKNQASYWWNGPIEEFIPPSMKSVDPSTLRKGTDTMDIWFDSGTAWSVLTSRGVRTPGKQPLADVCLEGTDQHRGWFQSLILTAAAAEVKPYGTLITHGYVLDQQGKKMSKSLGNIISPITIIEGGPDMKKEPAYGADVLRMWAASVDYTRDMSIGPKVLAQASEWLRKVRNTARFMLGNIGADDTSVFKPVPHSELGLAERYVMSQLYNLERGAKEAYMVYDFPKVVTSLTHFANITLSSLYFDITKDSLYADDRQSRERRAVITVLREILDTLVPIMAPVVPHLAEEIHAAREPNAQSSVFLRRWKEVDSKWNDPQAQADMNILLNVRGSVLDLLERARRDGRIKSSLEAQVFIRTPSQSDTASDRITQVLRDNENFLKTLFIVSDAGLHEDKAIPQASWTFENKIGVEGTELLLTVRPASKQKCPRCWTYTRAAEEEVCGRCHSVLGS